MANKPVSAIRARLETVISGLSAVQQVIPANSVDIDSGYPAVKIYLADIDNEYLANDNANDWKWVFSIEVLVDTTAKANDTAEDDFQDAIEAIRDGLISDPQLNSTCDFSEITNTTIATQTSAQGVQKSAIITLLVTVYEDGS